MRHAGIVLTVLAAVTVGLLAQPQPAAAAFHCMRIHAVMAGFNGDNTTQYVELRMDLGGQTTLFPRTIKFYDSTGTLKATFTFPDVPPSQDNPLGTEVPNPNPGDSILIATQEFNNLSTGTGGVSDPTKHADFAFSNANTVGANGGDPLHPVQGPSGKVGFAEGGGLNCAGQTPIDTVAYGSFGGTVDYGTAASALPSPSDNRSLRLNNLNTTVSDNSTEYSLEATSNTTFTVSPVNLATDLTTPRNNARVVGTLLPDADGDGVADGSDLCSGTAPLADVDANGCSQAQVDDDADGVCDPGAPSAGPAPGCTGSDICPGTAPLANVDANGCSQAQVDGDADGVCDPSAPSTGPTPGCTGSDSCPSTANPGQEDYDGDALGDACDPDSDDDGYTDEAESGTPLCGNGVNDDDFDDVVVDDGCPGGPSQAGSFSEGQFNIGTNPHGRCEVGPAAPSSQWPPDLVSGPSAPQSFSNDTVDIQDLSLYIVPNKILNTSPGPGSFYDGRMDVVPGPTTPTGNWIDIADLSNLVLVTPPMDPFNGTATAFNGPACTATTLTIDMGDLWFGSAACNNDGSGTCSTVLIGVGDSVRWSNVGALGHTASHCPDNNLNTCATPPARAFEAGTIAVPVAPATTSATFTFPTPGTFLYRCQIHPLSMRATLIVLP